MLTGRCYCGAVQYELDSAPIEMGQCHCRECQYITGGGANYFMMAPSAGFRWTAAEPKDFTRSDLDHGVTRQFCPTCGTHITTRLGFNPQVVILKVGTLDDLSGYQPKIALWLDD